MWREREVVAQMQFDRVSQVMFRRNERKVLEKSKKRVLREHASEILDKLVEAKIRCIPRKPTGTEKDRTLARSCKRRKKDYLTALYKWFVARSAIVAKTRASAAVDWARLMVQSESSPEPVLDFKHFLRERLNEATQSLTRPTYCLTLCPVVMAELVHVAIGKNTI